MDNQLYRSRDDRMLAGVCGGLGEYFNLDPTLIRVLFAVAVLAGFGTGIVIYIVLAIIMPPRPLEQGLEAEDIGETMPEIEPAAQKVSRVEEQARSDLGPDE